MTSPARSMTTRWHSLFIHDRPRYVAGGDGPISCREHRNWHCATSRKSFAQTPQAQTPTVGGDRRTLHWAIAVSQLPMPKSHCVTANEKLGYFIAPPASWRSPLNPPKKSQSAATLSDAAAVDSQRERALDLLGQAVERTPPQERAAFWSDVVQSDHAFTAIRRHSAYARIGMAAVSPRPK